MKATYPTTARDKSFFQTEKRRKVVRQDLRWFFFEIGEIITNASLCLLCSLRNH